MEPPKRTSSGSFRWLLFAATVLTGLVGMASLASAGPGKVDEARSRPLGCLEFDGVADSEESHDVFDPENGELLVATPDAEYVLSEHDASCAANPEARSRLEHARAMANDAHRVMCEDFKRYVAEGRTEVNGRRINLDAARRALQGRCVDWLR